VLTWKTAQAQFPWGIMLVMGSAVVISNGVKISGLASVVGVYLAGVSASLGSLPLMFAVTTCIAGLTQLTSNLAAASVILPLLIPVAQETLQHPLLLLLPATVGSSFGFMLPGAAGPNTVVFTTERVAISDFLQTGALVTAACVLICTPVLLFTADLTFGVLGPFPQWACDYSKDCSWLEVAGVVGDTWVDSQACVRVNGPPTMEQLCRLRNGTHLVVADF